MCYSIYRYAKADKNKEWSCLQYWDVNKLHG